MSPANRHAAQQLLWTSSSFFEEAEYHFYGARARAACYCDSAPANEREQHLDALAGHHKQLQVWAENCPENFENRAPLVGTEIARLEGRDLDAMRLYERAIRSARDNGFVHNEALAHERASDFYRAREIEQSADLRKRCEELLILHPNGAGIDIGASELFIAVGADCDPQSGLHPPDALQTKREHSAADMLNKTDTRAL